MNENPSFLRRLVLDKLWFWVPVAPLVAADLWTKSAVYAFLKGKYGTNDPIMPEFSWLEKIWEGPVSFSLVYWKNKGTIWGLAKDFTDYLIVLRGVALVMIAFVVWRLPAKAKLTQVVLGLIMAGAVGNLYDNLTQEGHGVRDFLKFEFGSYTFPAFNVADSCICVGAFTLAIVLWRAPPEPVSGDAGDGDEVDAGPASRADGAQTTEDPEN